MISSESQFGRKGTSLNPVTGAKEPIEQTEADGDKEQPFNGEKETKDGVDPSVLSFMNIPHGKGCSHCALAMGQLPTFKPGPDGKIARAEVAKASEAMKSMARAIGFKTVTHENRHYMGLSGAGFGVSASAPQYNMDTMTTPDGETISFENGGHVNFVNPGPEAAGNDPNQLRAYASTQNQVSHAATDVEDASSADLNAAASANTNAAQALAKAAEIEANPNKFKDKPGAPVPDDVLAKAPQGTDGDNPTNRDGNRRPQQGGRNPYFDVRYQNPFRSGLSV